MRIDRRRGTFGFDRIDRIYRICLLNRQDAERCISPAPDLPPQRATPYRGPSTTPTRTGSVQEQVSFKPEASQPWYPAAVLVLIGENVYGGIYCRRYNTGSS